MPCPDFQLELIMAYKKKLIEVALPLQAISKEAAREKSIRHGHPSTLHLYWARRPLAAARAVLWASLVDDPSGHPDRFPTEEAQSAERRSLFAILTELVKWQNTNNPDVLAAARAKIAESCGGELPVVLDPFCGGGTIPLEAQRLGLPAHGGDLNPVAVLITRAMVEIPPRFAGFPPVNPEARQSMAVGSWEGARGLADDIRYYGKWMRDRAFERIGHLYPRVRIPKENGGRDGTVVAWIWARTVQSPDPAWDGHVPLITSWVLRRKPKKPIVYAEPIIDHDKQSIGYRIGQGDNFPKGGTVRGGRGTCVATGAAIPNDYIRSEAVAGKMGTQLVALVTEGPDGKAYLPPVGHMEVERPEDAPSVRLVESSRYMVPSLYGLTTTESLFTDRQLVALTTFSQLLPEVLRVIEEDACNAGLMDDGIHLRGGGRGITAYAEAIVTYLAFAVDRCADYWSSVCRWGKSRETIGDVFARPAIPMVWDFAEANPFSTSSGNWLGQVDWVKRAVARLPAGPMGRVLQKDVVARIGEVEHPVVSTDPPYYDNVPYSDISDFFYVWMRRNLSKIWPEELSTLVTPKSEELVADPIRHGSKQAAREHFESGMSRVWAQLSQSQHPGYPATIFYAFKQTETKAGQTTSTGWETFLQGLVDTGHQISATWPVRTEMPNRPRALLSAALASSIVIVCRPRPADSPLATRGEFLAALRSELPSALRLLRDQAIAPVDMAQSMIGPGMAVFSRYSRVLEADGTVMPVRQALGLINQILEETLSEEETEFDYETRWALTWYQQNGAKAGPYGDAETLSKAKNTSVSSVVRAGIATSSVGKVQLVPRPDLDLDWDPRADPSPKVWQVTQHLLAHLGRSETEAADFLRQAGSGMGDRARQLAYLLYQTADRQGWAQERVVYNMLVTVWPTLVDLAAQPSPGQGSLLEA
jgi:putative DNA methylase